MLLHSHSIYRTVLYISASTFELALVSFSHESFSLIQPRSVDSGNLISSWNVAIRFLMLSFHIHSTFRRSDSINLQILLDLLNPFSHPIHTHFAPSTAPSLALKTSRSRRKVLSSVLMSILPVKSASIDAKHRCTTTSSSSTLPVLTCVCMLAPSGSWCTGVISALPTSATRRLPRCLASIE